MFRSLRRFFYTLGLGAAAMYLYDPDRGNRRRAMLRDQMVRMLNETDDMIAKGTRDLSNRSSGLIADAKATVSREQVSDDVLVQRVRSKIGGGLVGHPRAIRVSAEGGIVTLSGPILTDEVHPLLARVATIRGVRRVENQLEVHDQPGEVPALQGEPVQDRSKRTQGSWTPGIRLLATTTGGLLTLSGMRRGGIMGTARSIAGLGLLARGLTNRGFGQLFGMTEQPDAVTVRKGIQVDAPVQEVFNFWQNFANFPLFMENLHEVRDLGDGRSHWVAAGPVGTPVEWDARITGMIPDQMIAWESEPGSQVKQAGTVRFAPAENNTTHVNVQMSYTPPAGLVGHAVASFFGASPKQAMDQDLIRFKSLIERGKTSTESGTVTRDQVGSNQPMAGQRGSLNEQETRSAAHRQVQQRQEPEIPRTPPTPGQSERGSQSSSNWVDEVGRTGVYPASSEQIAPEDAQAQGMASWGQGERGAAGYEDSGSSEIAGLGEETDFGSVIPGPSEEPDEES